jgi:hypothetical protein
VSAAAESNTHRPPNARICLLSLRHVDRHVSRCAEYEFEDIICAVDDVDLLVPEPRRYYPLSRRVANRMARHVHIARFGPGLKVAEPTHDYDVFMAICQQPYDLLALNSVRNWRKRCRKSVCWLVELWAPHCAKWRSHLKLLAEFDQVFLMFNTSIAPAEAIIGKPCHFMAPGIDTLPFCPYPNPPERCIDVFSLGRRSQATHRALLRMAEQGKIFYLYDTISQMETFYPVEHRRLIASKAKRSRYFIANAPKINRQSESGGQIEISYRFIEGAAAGTVMIGDPGQSETFARLLDWPDAILRMPYDATNIKDLLAQWDAQPQRLERIRENGVVQSLLRHDWVYRWRAILESLGLEPRPALLEREGRLRTMAEQIQRQSAVLQA